MTIAPPGSLTYRAAFRLYLPLAVSWLFMALEAPIAAGMISRHDDPNVHTAALNILMALCIFIESPVIDLLATSTTLAVGRRSFASLQRFTVLLCALVTLVHGLVAFTPLYDLITRNLLHLPRDVATQALPAMQIMLLWSAFIGWRRFLQGALIRAGSTRLIGFGTSLRVTTMAIGAFVFSLWSPLPSIQLVAIMLMCSVVAESVFIHIAGRPVIHESLSSGEDDHALGLRRLVRFHWPLTATTMMMLTGMPIVSAALSRSSEPVLQLAGWQLGFTLVFLFRTVTFALPEPVIALYRDRESADLLRRFCGYVGLAMSAGLLLMAATGLDRWFFAVIIRAEEDAIEVARIAVLLSVPVCLINALQSYARGILTAEHMNGIRLAAVLVNSGTLIGLLVLSVVFGRAGVGTAAGAVIVAMVAEGTVLWVAAHRRLARRWPAGTLAA